MVRKSLTMLALLLAVTACSPDPPPTTTPRPIEVQPTASPTGIGTPIAVVTSGDLRFEVTSAQADPLQIQIQYVIHNVSPELLTTSALERLTADGRLDLRGPLGWSQQSSGSQPGSAPGTLEGKIVYTQEEFLPLGGTITVPLSVALILDPETPITEPPSTGSGVVTESAVEETSVELLHSFFIHLELPVIGPLHNIDVGQTQTVNDVSMTLQGVWVSQSIVRAVFCPDLTLDYETWNFTLVGNFDGVEVTPTFRGHYEDLSYYCEMYDYTRPDSELIEELTFTIDALRGDPPYPFTQADIDAVNVQLADQGIEVELTGDGLPSFVRVPDGMTNEEAWEIIAQASMPSLLGPWLFTVDVP
jgi:hypothetical protein